MRKFLSFVLLTVVAFQFVASGWLGILVQDLTPDLAARYRLSSTAEGVLVTRVEFGSPAMKAGLKEGDLIISLNNNKISDSAALVKEVSKLFPGDEVPMTIIRKRGTKNLSILLGSAHRFTA